MATKDHWSAERYNAAASMVPQLTKTVVSYLDVQPNDRILDLGCGDGQLTAKLAEATTSGWVLGLDSSPSLISTAQATYTLRNCRFDLVDCTKLNDYPSALDGSWDKVFSNAAMHWILRIARTRMSFFDNVHQALKPGGLFVFEQGGEGNVAEVQTASIAALVHAGLSVREAKEASPWFFPSTTWMSSTLETAGFDVLICELEYRPTKLNPDNEDQSGGLVGWVKLMCAQFLDKAPEGKKDQVLQEICRLVDAVVTREEDCSRWLGYTRLRAVARRK